MPRLLAFDTSTESMAIALVDGSREWCLDLPGGPKSSTALLPTLHRLLEESGLEWSALEAIGFGRGPGAFTGLRTACAVAQGLAFGLDVPVLPLDTLQIVAEDASGRTDAPSWWVAMDARMQEVYAGQYARDGDGWRAVDEPALYPLDALRERWTATRPSAVAGSALAPFAEQLGLGASTIRDDQAMPTSAALARCLRQAAEAGAFVPAELALPLYLRDKVALTTAERERAKASKVVA